VVIRSVTDFNLTRAMEVFVAVVEIGQVTAAAEALGMTQSAASQQLRNLETALGVVLLDRATRPISVTHAGDVVYRRACRILNEIDDLRSDVRRLSSAKIPILRIGLLASIATALTPGLTDLVRSRLEIPEVSLSAGLATEHHTDLASRRTDIAITSELPFDTTDYTCVDLLEEDFLLVVPADYDGPTQDIDALAEHLSFVRFSAHTPVGRRTDQHLQRLRLNLPRAIEADRSSMVVAGVSSGKGFGILSPTLLIDAIVEGMALRVMPLPFQGFVRTIRLVSRRSDLSTLNQLIALTAQTILIGEAKRLLPRHPDCIRSKPLLAPNS
jgi:DNA-binding transcriptional LysR family regulator